MRRDRYTRKMGPFWRFAIDSCHCLCLGVYDNLLYLLILRSHIRESDKISHRGTASRRGLHGSESDDGAPCPCPSHVSVMSIGGNTYIAHHHPLAIIITFDHIWISVTSKRILSTMGVLSDAVQK